MTGVAGQAKITQYTRYLTVMLAVLVSVGYVALARSGNLFPGTDCSATNHPLVPHSSAITVATMIITMVSGAAVVAAVIGFVVFMEQAQRRIPVQYAKRMTGRRVYGGTSTYTR